MANGDVLFPAMFAGMLIAGTLLVLLSPLFFKLTEEVKSWKLYALLALVIGVMGLSLYVVYLALSDPLFFIPFVVLVFGLRVASPTFLFRSLRDRFELRKFWPIVKILMAAGFLAYAGYLTYTILAYYFGQLFGFASSQVDYSELLLMAVGGAFIIIRLFARILPESLRERPTVWIAAILLSVAFSVLAPFAFPGYDIYYRLAGLAGWVAGFIFIWRLA